MKQRILVSIERIGDVPICALATNLPGLEVEIDHKKGIISMYKYVEIMEAKQ